MGFPVEPVRQAAIVGREGGIEMQQMGLFGVDAGMESDRKWQN